MLDQVVNLMRTGQLTEARSLCKKLSLSNKKSPDIWLMMGDINKQLGDLKKAETNYRKAIELKSSHSMPYARLAMLFHSQGKFKQAEHSYRQSLKLDEQQPLICFNLASVLQEQDCLQEAEQYYQLAIKYKPDYAKAYSNLGYLFRGQDKLTDSENCYRKALQLEPGMAEIYCNLGVTLYQSNQFEEAESCLRQSLQLDNKYADAWSALGAVQLKMNQSKQSCFSYEQALSLDDKHAEALYGYAKALSSISLNKKALSVLDKSIKNDPDNYELYLSKALIYTTEGQPEEGIRECEYILTRSPDHQMANILIASAYEKKGDTQKAYEYLQPNIDLDNPQINVAVTFLSLAKAVDRVSDAIDYAEKLISSSEPLLDADRYPLHFKLGTAYDSVKDFDNAFSHFQKGNQLKKEISIIAEQYDFNVTNLKRRTQNIIDVFSEGFQDRFCHSDTQSNAPIFIVGMPRSGTSLVEQIIASHPDVYGAGELEDLSQLVESMPIMFGKQTYYPDILADLNQQDMSKLANGYLSAIAKLSDGSEKVTDKMPGNFIYLGMIELLFPNARIIHCMRDPLDTSLSCYFQNFSQGHSYSTSLTELADVYMDYKRITRHWKKVLKIPVFNIQYEELVSNQEDMTRELIKFCGLEWDDNCLSFHKNKRLNWTASYDQVRQPMYKKSVKRWENYKPHIESLIEKLNISYM